jgi:hypothetical protein
MRLLVDENTAVQLMDPLRHLLRAHDVDHISEIGWKGKKDLALLGDARRRGYQAFLTLDRQQLADPDECRAIRDSRMHHIRYEQRKQGLAGLALAIGAVVAAMPAVMDHLEACGGQQLVRIVSLDPGHKRFEATDPSEEPPRCWSAQGRGRAPRRR